MNKHLAAGGALICLAGLLLYGFNTNNPNALRWAVFSIAAMIAISAWAWDCRLPSDGLTWAIIAFVGYAALSLLWSVDWREGLITFNQLTILAVIGLTALHIRRDWLIKGCSVLAVFGIAEHALISRLHPGIFGGLGNENFQAEYLVIIAPMACLTLVAWRNEFLKWSGVVACSAAVIHAVGYNVSDAKWAGFAGLAGLSICFLIHKRLYTVAFVTCALGFSAVASAYYASRSVAHSILERLELVYNTLSVWRDSPVFGIGIGGFNYSYPFHQDANAFVNRSVVSSVHNYVGAAHNEYAQALAVFGIAGFSIILLIGCLAFLRRNTDAAAWIGAASLFSFCGAAIVGFPAQNATTAILGVAALAVVVNRQVDVTDSQPVCNRSGVLA